MNRLITVHGEELTLYGQKLTQRQLEIITPVFDEMFMKSNSSVKGIKDACAKALEDAGYPLKKEV